MVRRDGADTLGRVAAPGARRGPGEPRGGARAARGGPCGSRRGTRRCRRGSLVARLLRSNEEGVSGADTSRASWSRAGSYLGPPLADERRRGLRLAGRRGGSGRRGRGGGRGVGTEAGR